MDALAGLKVIDAANLIAGPLAATLLGDLGADVIKIEHPRGDAARGHGYQKDGVGLWWKVIGRNKASVTLNLSHERGQAIFRTLCSDADIVIESFRPGTFERWGLGYDVLSSANPRLILLRVSGFGQEGPYRDRPGFGTLAEAMSGFAAITGEPDGPPTLPPFGLADGIAGFAGAVAILAALRARDVTGAGQSIDLAIYEPLMTVLGPHPTWFDQLGVIQDRTGNRSVNNAPRNTYRTRDGRWIAISTSATPVAARLLELVGHPEVTTEDWFQSGSGRVSHADELDRYVADWAAQLTQAEILALADEEAIAVAPIYDVAQLMADPQVLARGSIVTVEDEELGPVRVQDVPFRLSGTPGSIRSLGEPLGESTARVLGRLGLTADDLGELRRLGVVR